MRMRYEVTNSKYVSMDLINDQGTIIDHKTSKCSFPKDAAEKAIHLMGSKLEASLAIEGKFSEEGLLAMTQGEDMSTAMAKALVDGLEGEGVEKVWSNLNQRNISGYREEPKADGCLFIVAPDNFMKKLEMQKPIRRRRKVYKDPNQLSLFDDL